MFVKTDTERAMNQHMNMEQCMNAGTYTCYLLFSVGCSLAVRVSGIPVEPLLFEGRLWSNDGKG